MADPSLAARFPLAQRKYTPAMRAIARQGFRAIPGYEQVDLENDLLEALWRACMNYDPNQGAKFDTFVRNCWHNTFADLIKTAHRDKRRIDFDTESLDVDSVRMVVAEMSVSESAEDEVFARIKVSEIFRSGRKEAKR